MEAELLVLRVVHVVGGVFWVGAMAFNAFFLAPAMAMSGAAAGQIAINLQKRRLFTIMPIVAILTMLAGLRLMMITSTGFSADYFRRPSGMAYAASGALAILAFMVGMIVTRPSMARVAAIAQAAASDEISRERISAELRRMQARVRTSTMAVALLLLAAAVGMSVARYL